MDFNKRFIEFALYPAMELLRGNHVRRYLRELKETEKLSGAWMSLQELKEEYDNMETWSQIALAVAE